jgi:hypothetical protein
MLAVKVVMMVFAIAEIDFSIEDAPRRCYE